METTVQQAVAGWVLDKSVEPGARLRQGDLIQFEQTETELQRVGIIVTADCDLENRKHAGLVTMVPVVSAQVVLEHYLLIEDCEKKRALIESYAFSRYDINNGQDRDIRMSILREAVRDGPRPGREVDYLAATFALGLLMNISVASYKALMGAIESGPRKADALRDQIRSRGDLLILPDPRGLGITADIAWIRHIWQVPLNAIAIRTSEISSRAGERIARLDSPYRYRLTQLMAQVFSDIGLPNIPDRVEALMKEVYANA